MVDVKAARPRKPEEVLAEAAERAARIGTLGLIPTDTIRFPKPGRTSTWIYGSPHDINQDGSVSCFANGQFRAIRPERLEVKWKGPRGGDRWEPLVPPTPLEETR